MTTKNTIQTISTLLAVFILVAVPLSFAHAADDDVGGFSPDTFDNTGWYDTGSGYTPADSSTGWYDTGSGYTPTDANTGWYDTGSGYTPSSYSSGGYGGGYSTGGYSAGGYNTGGYSTGGGYTIGSSYPISTTPSNTSIYAPSNTCTGNSCNHDDHSVVNITNPAPVINNNNVVVGQTQVCASGYYGTYPNCYLPQPVVYNQPVQVPVYQQPIAYNTTPYVSLSQVPYTGLDLGFWGSIAYWGAFVLFALFAAYLIAIKRVQNRIANSLKVFLFGSTIETTEEFAAPEAEVAVEAAPEAPVAVAQTNGDTIDSFIMSQINRTARTA